ncbi:MAG: hypothetical protein U9O87_05290 [Verrucomicrobiota bacterium]|nr:hypothetical protein [Verrucomicrobiota bacterium]
MEIKNGMKTENGIKNLQAKKMANGSAGKRKKKMEQIALIAKISGYTFLFLTVWLLGFLVWKFFLDPSGKISWQHELTANFADIRFLNVNKDFATVLINESKTLTISTKDGITSAEIVVDKKRLEEKKTGKKSFFVRSNPRDFVLGFTFHVFKNNSCRGKIDTIGRWLHENRRRYVC